MKRVKRKLQRIKIKANKNIKNQEVNTQIGFHHIYAHP
jgi:hypothetical protein